MSLNLITDKNLDVNFSILQSREEFVTLYCEQMGWDKFDLTHEQIITIRQQKEWKNAGLILS